MAQKLIGARRAVVSGTLGRWLYTICQALVQLAIVPVAIESLGIETYGLWLSVSAVVGWLSITDPGMGTTLTCIVTRDVADGHKKAAAATIARCLGLVCVGLAVTVFIALVGTPFLTAALLPSELTRVFTISMLVSAVAFALNRAVGPLMSVSVAELENIFLASVQIASAIAQLAVSLVGLKLGYGVLALAVGALARSLVLVVPMVVRTAYFLIENNFLHAGSEGRPVRELVNLAVANYPAVMLSTLTSGLDLLLIGLLNGGSAAAVYSVNGRPLDVMATASLGLSSALVPVYARRSTQQPRQLVARGAFQLAVLVLLASVFGFGGFCVASAGFVTLWAGPEAIGSATLVCGLATAALATLAVDVLMQIAMADARRLHELSIIRLVEKAARGVAIGLAVYLAPFDVVPWCIAAVEALTIISLLRWMEVKIGLFSAPLNWRLASAMGLAAIALLIATGARNSVSASLSSVIVGSLVGGLMCVLLCVAASPDCRKLLGAALRQISGIRHVPEKQEASAPSKSADLLRS